MAPALDPDFASLTQSAPPAQVGVAAAPGGGLDADFAALATPATRAAAPTRAPILGPWASAIVRPIVLAASSLPYMAADAGVALGNILGGHVPLRNPDGSLNWRGMPDASALPLPSSLRDQALNSVTTQPTGLGKGAEFVSTALLSGRLPGMPTAARAAGAVASRLTPSQQAALVSGEDLGMVTTPGRAYGSIPLQQIEAQLESQPATSGPFAALKASNQTALNRHAANAIGETANVVDSTVMGRAAERLGRTFDSIRNPDSIVAVDPKAQSQALQAIDDTYSGLLLGDSSIAAHPLVAQFSRLMDSGGANLQQLGQLSSKLGKAAYKQMSGQGGDRDLGQALYDVKDYVDDLVQSALSGQDAATYAAARGQWRALALLTKPGVVKADGNVSGLTLANTLARTDKPGFLFGRNTSPLYQAARFAQAFRPLVGDSGTATRSGGLFSGIGPLLGAALGAGGAHAVGHGALEGAEIGAAGLPPLLNLASRAYLSPFGGTVARGLVNAPRAIPRMLPRAATGGLLASVGQ